jgi:hypothetical protein
MVPEHSSPGYGGRRRVAVDARGDHLEEDLAVGQRRGVLHLLRLQHLRATAAARDHCGGGAVGVTSDHRGTV